MRLHLFIPIALLFAHMFAHANIEWPVLYSLRAVEFTEALVLKCNAAFPADAEQRQAAFLAWVTRNQTAAAATRKFNLERIRALEPKLEAREMELELDKLQKSALSQIERPTPESWGKLCKDMTGWLRSEDSDVSKQVPDFMQPK